MHKLIKNIFDNLFFFLLFISTWLCIDTNFDNILALKNNITIKNVFLAFRAALPIYLVAFLLIIIFINKSIKINFYTNNKQFNFILFIISLSFIVQSYGLTETENNIYYLYYVLVALIIVFLTLIAFNKNYQEISYYICLSFLALIVIIYSILNYNYLITTANLQLYGTFPNVYVSLEGFSNNVIRSSGLSRSSMILLIPIFFISLINNSKYRLYILSIYLILASNIYLTQARIVVLFYMPFICFSIFWFLKKKSLKYRLKKIFIFFILPIIFFNSFLVIKEEFRTKHYTYKSIAKVKELFPKLEEIDLIKGEENKIGGFRVDKKVNADERGFYELPTLRKMDEFSFTSNRYQNWKNVISYSKRPIMGYGVLGDRFLIDLNSHNLLIYSYASGGLVSSVLMLLIAIRYTYVCIIFTFFSKLTLSKNNIILISSVFTVSFLLFRGITENGIGIFSIDLIVFLTCIGICEKFFKKNKKNIRL